MKHNATLKKISTTLGISISTVSRALKDHPDIAKQTKQKVKELAQALDYEPNTFAIQLRTNHSNLFGIVVPTISNNFYESFIAAVEEESRKSGYSLLILQSADNAEKESESLRICRQNRVRGVFACITPETINFAPFEKFDELDIPVIYFDKLPENLSGNKVSIDDDLSARMAAEIITEKKKKNILAIFGNEFMSISKRRVEAFTNQINNRKNRKIKLAIKHASSSAEAREHTVNFLSSEGLPDCIFCMSDEILIGVMKELQEREIKIPETISVISLSNGFIPTLYHPAISYVETSGYKLGKLAYTQMLACISGNKQMQELSVKPVYVSGGSL